MSSEIVCPKCGLEFNRFDSHEYEKHQAMYIMYKHGMPLRAIARVFGIKEPQSVKVRIETYKRIHNITDL